MSTCVYNAPSLLYTFLQIYGIFFYLLCAQTASTCRCPCRPMICSHFFFVYWLTQTANTLRLLQVHFTFSDAAPAPRLKTSLPSRHGLALEQPALSWSQSAGTCTVTAVFPMFLCLLASPFYIALCCCLGDRRCTGKLGCDDCLHMCARSTLSVCVRRACRWLKQWVYTAAVHVVACDHVIQGEVM